MKSVDHILSLWESRLAMRDASTDISDETLVHNQTMETIVEHIHSLRQRLAEADCVAALPIVYRQMIAQALREARAEGYAGALEDFKNIITADIKGMHFSERGSSLKAIVTDSYDRILTTISALKDKTP